MTLSRHARREKIDRLAELAAARRTSAAQSLWREAFKRLRRNPAAIIGAVILRALRAGRADRAVPRAVQPDRPDRHRQRRGALRRRASSPARPREHWLGYDHQGRDEFSRMIVGARQTLLVGVVATLFGLAIGCADRRRRRRRRTGSAARWGAPDRQRS